MIEIFNHKYSFPKLLTWGFLAIILLGTILLSLPIATRSGRQLIPDQPPFSHPLVQRV